MKNKHKNMASLAHHCVCGEYHGGSEWNETGSSHSTHVSTLSKLTKTCQLVNVHHGVCGEYRGGSEWNETGASHRSSK